MLAVSSVVPLKLGVGRAYVVPTWILFAVSPTMPTWSSHTEIAGSHGFVIVRLMFLAPFIDDLTCGPAGGGDRSAVGYSLRGRYERILYAERVVATLS